MTSPMGEIENTLLPTKHEIPPKQLQHLSHTTKVQSNDNYETTSIIKKLIKSGEVATTMATNSNPQQQQLLYLSLITSDSVCNLLLG